MKIEKNNYLKHLDFIIADLLCIEVAYLWAYYLRHRTTFLGGDTIYIDINILLLVVDVCYVLIRKTHKDVIKRGVLKEAKSVFVNNVFIWLSALVYVYIVKQSADFSRTVFILGLILSSCLMFLVRLLLKEFVRNRLRTSDQLPNMLILTTPERASTLLRNYHKTPYTGYNLIGVGLTGNNGDKIGSRIEGVKVVCGEDTLEEYMLSHVVDDVMISIPYEVDGRDTLIHDIVQAGPRVHINLNYSFNTLPNRYVEDIGGYTVLSCGITKVTPVQMFMKRVIDIVGALVGLLITGVAALFVGPMIYKASPGPIFFAQERVGKNGRHFKMYKFRSMYLDAEERKKELEAQNEMKGFMFKMKNDPRIIGSEKGEGKGIGNFIRATSIDELPQFYNVLKGDMSLVGTRPPTAKEVEQYDLHHKVRLSMKPGITGLWQVSGRSDITDFEEVVQLDEQYISTWSLKEDIRILWKTVKVVLKKEGAA